MRRVCAALIVMGAAVQSLGAQEPELNAVLARAADYMAAYQKGLAVLVPEEMRETYTLRVNDTRIDGRAKYKRFRQFTVTTSEKTDKPKQ